MISKGGTLTDWRKINKPTDVMVEQYGKLFLRNQGKWITRSRLSKEHLGEEFTFKKKKCKLIGSAYNRDSMVILDISEDTYYFVHSDVVDSIILKLKNFGKY